MTRPEITKHGRLQSRRGAPEREGEDGPKPLGPSAILRVLFCHLTGGGQGGPTLPPACSETSRRAKAFLKPKSAWTSRRFKNSRRNPSIVA